MTQDIDNLIARLRVDARECWQEAAAALREQRDEIARLTELCSHAGLLKAQEEHNRVVAERDAAMKDAERCLWIMDHPETAVELIEDWMITADVNPTTGAWNDPRSLRHSIDAAIAKGKG